MDQLDRPGLAVKWGRVAAAAVPVSMVGGFMVFSPLMFAITAGNDAELLTSPASCTITLDAPTEFIKELSLSALSPAQLRNATTIYQVAMQVFAKDGKERALRAALVGLVTARQEARMLNLASRANPGSLAFPHDDVAAGDHDSVGIFQQRDAWGPMAVRMNVEQSARMFFLGGQQGQRGLVDIDSWWTMPVTVAAQTVQVSAFPNAYAQWEPLAEQIVKLLAGVLPASDPCGGEEDGNGPPVPAEVQQMLDHAQSLLGVPYLWGGTTASGVDCSGLIVYAWKQVGRPLRIRTAAQMYGESVEIREGQEQPGDLIFTQFDSSGPGHVSMVLDSVAKTAIVAPHTGDVVKIITYGGRKNQVLGRLKPSAWSR